MNPLPHQVNFPAITAAQIAAALGMSPQSIRKQLRSVPATGKTTVRGQESDTWRLGNLPDRLLARLKKISGGNDLASVAQLFNSGYANLSKKYLAAIEHTVKQALYMAKQDGREKPEWPDIQRVMKSGVMPADTALAAAIEQAAACRKAPANGSRR